MRRIFRNEPEGIEEISCLGFFVYTTRQFHKIAAEALKALQKHFLEAGFKRVEIDEDYWPGPHFCSGKHRVTPYIREHCKEGKTPTGVLNVMVRGNWIQDFSVSIDSLDKVVPRTLKRIESRETGWAEWEAKKLASEQAAREAEARALAEQQQREHERWKWYEERVAKLQNGELTTGIVDLDYVIRRWMFLPEPMRIGLAAMVKAIPPSSDEAIELARSNQEAEQAAQTMIDERMQTQR